VLVCLVRLGTRPADYDPKSDMTINSLKNLICDSHEPQVSWADPWIGARLLTSSQDLTSD